MRDLHLARPPYHLDRQRRSELVQLLLDLELTCRRYPAYGESIRAILRSMMGG
jgi:hypothetical protein